MLWYTNVVHADSGGSRARARARVRACKVANLGTSSSVPGNGRFVGVNAEIQIRTRNYCHHALLLFITFFLFFFLK